MHISDQLNKLAPFSAYLNSLRPGLQELIALLRRDYDYVSAPIYFWPFTPNILATGGFTNGYGFSNE